jgi:hypothetical protein
VLRRDVHQRWKLIAAAALVGGASICGIAAGPDERTELEALLAARYADFAADARYFAGSADLDGDGVAEIIVHVAGPGVCGTGGCDTLVFTRKGGALRLLARLGPGRPPIVVARSSTHGWRDLLVQVSGGGVPAGYAARLRFDGRSYTRNPTVQPAEQGSGGAEGRTVIAPFESYTEGRTIPSGKGGTR